MIFDRVTPLELRKKIKIFSFRSLSLQRLHTFNSNFIYGCIIGLCRSGSNLVIVWWFFLGQIYPPWGNFQFPLPIFYLDVCIACRHIIGMRWPKLNLVMVQWFSTELSLLKKRKKFLVSTLLLILGSNCIWRYFTGNTGQIRIWSWSNYIWQLYHLNLENMKYGIKILVVCRGIRGFDDTSSLKYILYSSYM
jgi:hypothetical protein